MNKTLIIAEKPSQARDYAKALGVNRKGDGYFENDQYIISWCIGHLFELNRPETYMDLEKVGKRWSVHRLPVLPRIGQFQHSLKSSTRKQYEIVARLLKFKEVTQVICGTDADREGQLLFQEVWDAVGCTKPLSRLWISSLTQEAIQEGMSKLRSSEEVEGLAQAGYGRSYADWDFGMNLTEGFTALFGSFDPVRKKPNVISIGRVQTPTLALVVEREWKIQSFIPLKYVELEAEFSTQLGKYKGKWFDPAIEATHEKESDKMKNEPSEKSSLDLNRAEEIIQKIKGSSGIVQSLKEKEISESHPLLFDLTSLTVTASKRFGFSAEKVLKIAQSLYEKKAITYPRTDCNYLPADILPKLPGHLSALKQGPHAQWAQEASEKPLPKGKRVINEITAHHAIIPTTETISPQKLTPDEQKIWDLIVLRFLSVWFPPARFKETEVITEVEGECFQTKGKVLLDPGWQKVEKPTKAKGETKEEKNTQNLPPLQPQETVQTLNSKALQKETKPPKRFTQGDLLKAMESAGKEIEDEFLRQQLKGKGLGTVATRAAIIENLLDRGYLIQDQKSLCPTEKGTGLIRLIKEKLPHSRLLISAEMTGQMEYELAQVERGELPLSQYMDKVEVAIKNIIEELRQFEKLFGKQPISLAPTKKEFMAQKPKNTMKTKKSKNKENNEDQENLEKTERLQITNTSKTEGSQRTTAIHERTRTQSKEESIPSNSPEILGVCPACGGSIIEGKKGYGCLNWREGCKFVLWKNPICDKVLTKAQVKSLLKKGKTPLIKGFRSKSGKNFSAYLVWDNSVDGKLKFEFESPASNEPAK